MSATPSLLQLRDRLVAIAHRDLADRTVSPGEAAHLMKLIDAATYQVKTYSEDTVVTLISAVRGTHE